MLCERCKKNIATTHVQSVINGVKKEADLCSECAAKEGYGGFSGFGDFGIFPDLGGFAQNSLAGMLASMFGESLPAGQTTEKRCDCCGATYSELAQTGKVGCPHCYQVFREELLPYLKRVHGSTCHIGKKNRTALVVSKDDELTQLRRKLEELVQNEKYEEAAVVRDEIRKYEGEKK